MLKFTPDEAEKHKFNDDILDFQNNVDADKCIIVEARIQELADINAGTICGNIGNTCFKNIAKKYPDVLVRTAVAYITDGNSKIVETSSCEMLIKDNAMGEDIDQLASDGDGSLRFESDLDATGPYWAYFETE